MATNSIQPARAMSYEPREQRTESRPESSGNSCEAAKQSRNVQEGNVTAAERVASDIRKEAIDGRKREPRPQRERKLDKRA